jgi:N-acetylglucosaminylphosphatidylinositol deacetylase
VETAVRRAKADVVLTFDSEGVSGHPNHVAAHRGVVRWRKTHTETEVKSKNPKAWALVTVHPARKFTMFADVFASWACETHVLAAATCPADLRRAMQMHRTQWVWYRKLFVVFSRYAYVNSLRRL